MSKLNTYQQVYRIAIDLHRYIQDNEDSFSPEEAISLRGLAREALAHVAETYSQKIPKAKRFFNFKAMATIDSLLMNFDFLYNLKKMEKSDFNRFYNTYEKIKKDLYKLNSKILNDNPTKS